jgi:hypothetical protein
MRREARALSVLAGIGLAALALGSRPLPAAWSSDAAPGLPVAAAPATIAPPTRAVVPEGAPPTRSPLLASEPPPTRAVPGPDELPPTREIILAAPSTRAPRDAPAPLQTAEPARPLP